MDNSEKGLRNTIYNNTSMKDINYKPKCYRLAEQTIKNLEEISFKEKLSYNLLFSKFINTYNKKHYEN